MRLLLLVWVASAALSSAAVSAEALSSAALSSAALSSEVSGPKLATSPVVSLEPDAFAHLEKQLGGRIGVMALNTATGRHLGHRANERFLMCSTFKLLLVAQVLHRVDAGEESLDRLVAYGAADLLSYAPVTSAHVAEGMTVQDLCIAALQYSDNTAANLLLRTQGGPAGLTRYVQSLGDAYTHLDRTEPALNEPIAGQDLDTTTPAAMAATLQRLVLGSALSDASRHRLEAWLQGNTTGGTKLKAGLPALWRMGDKTGSGPHAVSNDIGVAYAPGKPPIIITAYTEGCTAPRAECDGALREIAAIIVRQHERAAAAEF